MFTVEAVPAPPEMLAPMHSDLRVPIVTFTLSAVQVGESTRGVVSIPVLANFGFPTIVDFNLNYSGGGLVKSVGRNMAPTFRTVGPRSPSVKVNRADLTSGA